MTRFEKDFREATEGNEIEVLAKRKHEIEGLRAEFRKSHGFRRTCLGQEIERLTAEYEKIESIFC